MAFSPVSSQGLAKIREVSNDDNQREAKEKKVQAIQRGIETWNENLTQELGTQREVNFLRNVNAMQSQVEISWQPLRIIPCDDIELHGAVNLQAIEKDKNVQEIVNHLKEVGRGHLAKDEWAQAAKLFNQAIALIETHENSDNGKVLLSLMAETERCFLLKECRLSKPNCSPKTYLQWRERLKNLRNTIQGTKEGAKPVEGIIYKEMSLFVEEILKSGIAILGKTPCNWSLFVVGPWSRGEMGLYTPIAFGLMIDKYSSENCQYFRHLMKWFEIQMIHLGETATPSSSSSGMHKGFSFAYEGKTPLGGDIEFIHIPEQYVKWHQIFLEKQNLHLANELQNGMFFCGHESLYNQFAAGIKKNLSPIRAGENITIGQENSLKCIAKHLFEFTYPIETKMADSQIFCLDTELFTFLVSSLSGLAGYYQIDEQCNEKKIEGLVKKRVLSADGGEHLKKALRSINRLRHLCHRHYQSDCTDTRPPDIQGGDEGLYPLKETDIDELIEIYRVVLPFCQCLFDAHKWKDFSRLAKESFYDSSILAKAKALDKMLNPAEAKKYYRELLALKSDNIEAQLAFAEILLRTKEYREAAIHLEALLPVAEEHPSPFFMLRAFRSQAILFHQSGDTGRVVETFYAALQILVKRNIIDLDAAAIYNALGSSMLRWKCLKMRFRALKRR